MVQMIYSSAATQPFTPAALNALLYNARARNAMNRVSGMLVYDEGSFLQVLEGPEKSVERILESIFRDPRHTNPRTISKRTVMTREFDGWSMSFVRAGGTSFRPAGQVDYFRELPELIDAPTHAMRYLRFFQEGLYRQKTA